MSVAHVLLNLLNELKKSDKMRGKHFITLSQLFYKFNNTVLSMSVRFLFIT